MISCLLVILIFTIQFLLFNAKEDEIIELEISQSRGHDNYKEQTALYHVNIPQAYKTNKMPFLFVKAIPDSQTNLLSVYISTDIENATFSDSDYKSINTEKPFIYLPFDYYSTNPIYIRVICEQHCQYNIIVEPQLQYEIEENTSRMINLTYVNMPTNVPYVFYFNPTFNQKSFQITIESIDRLMKVKMFDSSKERVEFPMLKVFDHGVGIIIDSEDYLLNSNTPFVIELYGFGKNYYTITHRLVENESIKLCEIVNVVMKADKTNNSQRCFRIYEREKEKGYYGHYTKHPFVLNGRTFTRNVYLTLFNEKRNIIEDGGKIIYSTGYYDVTESDKICISPLTEFNHLGFTFQVLKETDMIQSQPYNMPLLSNIPTFSKIPKGTLMYYRVLFPPIRSYHQIFYHVHSSRGQPTFYKFQIDNYPIQITPFNIPQYVSLQKLSLFNIIHSYGYGIESRNIIENYNPFLNSKQIAVLVNCPDTSDNDCEFEITVGLENEAVLLPHYYTMMRRMSYGATHHFRFTINSDQPTNVYIYLTSLTGFSELKVERESIPIRETQGIYHAGGKIQYYEFIKEKEKTQTLKGSYYVTVKGSSIETLQGYYTIHFFTSYNGQSDERNIRPGRVSYELLNKKQKPMVYRFMNNSIKQKNNFLITIASLNCDISIVTEKETIIKNTNSFIIKPTDPIYNQNYYAYEMNVLSTDSESKDEEEDCVIITASTEISLKNEITLTEGTRHSIILNKDFPHIKYFIPIISKTRDNNFIISLNKRDEGKVKIQYYLQYDQNINDAIIMTKTNRNIMISDNIIDKCLAAYQICPIILIIEKIENTKKPDESIRFAIEVVIRTVLPTYIKKGEIRNDYLIFQQSNTLHYYTDIGNKRSGDIVIDFKGASVVTFAYIVSKVNSNEKNNWNKRVQLTNNYYSTNVLKYSQFNQSIIFTEENTKNCADHGCELYIGINSMENTIVMTDFSIFIREEKVIIKLPENYLVVGSLYNTIKEDGYHYYTLHVHSDTDRLLLNLMCKICFGYAKLGREQPTPKNADWEFDGQNGFVEISSSDPLIQKSSMQGQDITFSIGTKEFEFIYSSLYTFKVITPIKNLPAIIEVTPGYNSICFTKTPNEMCHFLYPILDIKRNGLIYLQAMTDAVFNSKLDIYTYRINESEYGYLTPLNISQVIPTEDNHAHSSSKFLATERYTEQIISMNWGVGSYLFVTIKSRQPGKLTLFSLDTAVNRISLQPNTKQLLTVIQHTQIMVSGNNNDYYFYEFTLVSGKGVIRDSYGHSTILDNERKHIAIIVNPKSNLLLYDSLSISPQQYRQEGFVFFIEFTVRPRENFDEIKYGKNNYIIYRNAEFPLIYYLPIENEEEDIMINVRLSKVRWKVGKNLGDEDFDLQGFVCDDNWIIKRKKEDKNDPHILESITDNYNQALKLGRLTFTSSMIKKYVTDNKKYLCMCLKPKESNKHNYVRIATQITAIPTDSISSKIILPSNQFFFSKATSNKPIIFKLYKNDIKDNLMEIEYSSPDPSFDFSIIPITEENNDQSHFDYYHNGSLLPSTDRINGRTRMQLMLNNKTHGVAFAIFKSSKSNPSSSMIRSNPSFMIKYQCERTEFNHLYLTNTTVKWEMFTEHKILNVVFKSLTNKEDNVNKANYYIYYYSDTNTTDITSFYLNEDPIRIDKLENKTEKMISHGFSNIPKTSFYFIIVVIGKIGNMEEILLYDVAGVGIKKRGETSHLFIIGVVLLIIFIITLILIYKKYHKNAEKKKSLILSKYMQLADKNNH